ncbi:MAG: pyrroline-5-carboxylate reductase [Oscillospiraceae bacterium]
MKVTKNKLGVIGAGNMGMAIVNGIVNSNIISANQIGILVHSQSKLPQFEAKGFKTYTNSAELYSQCEIVLLGVKPQIMPTVLDEISAGNKYDAQILISIAAGISIEYIQSYFKEPVKIIRVMPNTPLLIGEGASVFSRSENVTDDEYDNVIALFNLMGCTKRIDENQMNEIIPVHGSSPAFVYYIINCMLQSSVKAGIDPDVALDLICQTFIGATHMITKTDVPLQQLIKNVCSPGGTTLAALKVFDDNNLNAIFDEAFDQCIKRAYELGR